MLYEVKFVMGSFCHNLPHAHLLFFQWLQTLVRIQLLFTWISKESTTHRSTAHSVMKSDTWVNAYILLHIPN